MGKALIVLTSHNRLGDTGRSTGFHLAEMTRAYRIFKEAGYEIDIVSPEGGKPPVDPRSNVLDDPANREFLNDPHAVDRLENSWTPDRVNPDDYVLIYFSGGHGTMWDFPENRHLIDIASHIYSRRGIVASVCHGPAALLNVRLLNGSYLVDGKEVSSYTNEEEAKAGLDEVVPFLLESQLEERGAKFVKSPPGQEKVAVSERLVTGQNSSSAEGVAKAAVDLVREYRTVAA